MAKRPAASCSRAGRHKLDATEGGKGALQRWEAGAFWGEIPKRDVLRSQALKAITAAIETDRAGPLA